jgi:cellulose synthase (UDP-forming)
MVTGFVYLVWLYTHLNMTAWYVALPFFFIQLFTYLMVGLSLYNHWEASYRTERPELPNPLPSVAVVIPTYKEPKEILQKTIKSVLHLSYEGELVIVVSNDDQEAAEIQSFEPMMAEIARHWEARQSKIPSGLRQLHLIHTETHDQAKAGNLNQSLAFLREHYPNIDLVLTQDADEMAHVDLVKALVGYFSEDPRTAYVQTIKQVKVSKGDPFGNHDVMWYGRTAAARDAAGAMYACGSGVIWRISALEDIGGFSTWNMVEDLTTSYELLANGWSGKYHYEALSSGLAPEDLPNFFKQRGTWAIDTMRIFFWDNPFMKKGLTLRQKLQFVETPLFYLNGVVGVGLVILTFISLMFELWPTTSGALRHALFMLPAFITLEIYFLMLGGAIPYHRVRQFWVGLGPLFAVATYKAFVNGPDKKPIYMVTRKENEYGNYLKLVWPQIVLLVLIASAVIKVMVATPLYSGFDWATFFWGFYMASFFLQIIKVAIWNYALEFDFQIVMSKILDFVPGLAFSREEEY